VSAVQIAVLAVVIGANNAAVAVALGALGQAHRRWRIAAVVGAFEFAVPLVGVAVGRRIADALADGGRWAAVALLAGLGVWTIMSARRDTDEEAEFGARVATWRGLALLAGGLSVDNLVVGVALGITGGSPLVLATAIATVSVVATLVGLEIGAAGRRLSRVATETAAGTLLLVIAAAVAAGRLG